MPSYAALLRAVNVGGTGKLPMPELKAMCVAEGFENVQTYIASGNVVFSAAQSEREVKTALEKRLKDYAGKPVGVIVRTAQEMANVLNTNPFPDALPNWTVAIFLDAPPPADTLDLIRDRKDEEVRLGKREIYVAYSAGMGRSRLKIPAAANGTAGTSTRSPNSLNSRRRCESAGPVDGRSPSGAAVSGGKRDPFSTGRTARRDKAA